MYTNCSVHQEHKHTILCMWQSGAYGTFFNSCSYNTPALSQNVFIWYFNWERHMLWWEGNPMIAVSSISLPAVTLCMGHTLCPCLEIIFLEPSEKMSDGIVLTVSHNQSSLSCFFFIKKFSLWFNKNLTWFSLGMTA